MKYASIAGVALFALMSICNFVNAGDPQPTSQPVTSEQRELKAARAQIARLQNKVDELSKQIEADKKQIAELKKQAGENPAIATPAKPVKAPKLALAGKACQFADDSVLVGSTLADAQAVLIQSKATLYAAEGNVKHYYLTNGVIDKKVSEYYRYDLTVEDGKITAFAKEGMHIQQ